MARIRTIKPQHVTDKELPKISLQAHLFWVLSWCFSDDEGVIENDPLLLKSQMFPRRKDVKVEQIEQWIEQLIASKFILPFTYEGENYLIQRTFKIHQKIDRPQASKIPDATIRRIIDECSTTQQPCIVKDSKGEDSSITPTGVDISEEYKVLVKDKKTTFDFIKNSKPLFIEPYVDFWNLFAKEKGMSEVKTITDARKKKFNVRVKEEAFDFTEIIKKASQSNFLLTSGKWFGFDWIIENESNYVKVLEGNYDNGKDDKETVQQEKEKQLMKSLGL